MKLPAQLQARLTYFPDTDPAGPASRWFPKGSDIVLRTQDGLALSAWLVRPTGSIGTSPCSTARATAATAPGASR